MLAIIVLSTILILKFGNICYPWKKGCSLPPVLNPESPYATYEEPIVGLRKQESMQLDKEKLLGVSFYNRNTDCSSSIEHYPEIRVNCYISPNTDETPLQISIRQKPIPAPIGESTLLLWGATADSNLNSDTYFNASQDYICEFIINCGTNESNHSIIAWKEPFFLTLD